MKIQIKKAFTLGEVLISITIIAFLAVLSMTYLRNNMDKTYQKLYKKAFNSLSIASAEINKEIILANENVRNQALKAKENVDETKFQKYPQELSIYLNKLASENEGLLNTTSSSTTTIYPMESLLNDKKINLVPTFITTDSMKYYFINNPTPTDPEDFELEDSFFMVWVDINGQRNPNITNALGTKKPDIVPFLISKKNGEVIPLGYPVYDMLYLHADVSFSDPDAPKNTSGYMTYNDARALAYQGKQWDLELNSLNFDTKNDSRFNCTKFIDKKYLETRKDTIARCTTTNNTESEYPPCAVTIK